MATTWGCEPHPSAAARLLPLPLAGGVGGGLASPSLQTHFPSPLQRSTCNRLTSLARSMPSSPGQSAASFCSASTSNFAVGAMRDRDRRRPLAPHQPGQRARIDAADPDPPPFRHPSGEILPCAVIARPRHRLAHHRAQRMRLGRFDILVVGADIADVREGEGDHLPRVARVGHHFLVTGHRGVEAQLADRLLPPRRNPCPTLRVRRRTPSPPVAPGRLRCGRGSFVGHWLGKPFRLRRFAMSLRHFR